MATDEERLVYEITVTSPGTKSQGWHGTLFGKDGKPVQAEPGKTVKTNVGEFVSIAETNLRTPYGMIHTDMVRWMTAENGNIIMDSDPWEYRLSVAQEGSKSEGWRGELRHSRGIIAGPGGDGPVKTPMGPYAWVANEQLWGLHGWIHVSWTRAKTAAPHKAA